MLHALALADLREDLVHLGRAIGVDQDRDRPADDGVVRGIDE
jgi:hypothetical protein